MTLLDVEFFSEALGKWTQYRMILPDRAEAPPPVLMQLHGLSDDRNAWLLRSNLVRHADRYPMAIVLPDGGTSLYLDWKVSDRLHKQRYESFLMQDIREHVNRHFRVAEGPWAIGGLSMGGFGAMRLGLKYPDRFRSIWSHSSVFIVDEAVDPALVQDHADVSPFGHAEALVKLPAERYPEIAFDCGVDDDLLPHNRAFHAHLDGLGIDHHYAEHPGDHTWDYWDEHVPTALARHAEVFGLPTLD